MAIYEEYFSSSTRILYNFFAIFGFRVWHKFTKGPHKEQDNWFLGYIFDLISSRRYEDALQFLKMSEALEYVFEDKSVENMILINKAQCLKWLGDNEACLNLLSRTDWSAHADHFILCVRVLRDDFDSAVEIIERIGTTGIIKFDEYCIWPVFKNAIEHSGFCDAVERVFGKRPIAVLPTRLNKKNGVRKSSKKSTAKQHAGPTSRKETRH